MPDWPRFWEEFRAWSQRLPFSPARDTVALYALMAEKVDSGKIPLNIALEFHFMDLAAHGHYQEAASMLPLLRSTIRLETMDEFFLRHLAIVALKADAKDVLRHIYLEAIRKNRDFDPAEQRLMLLLADVPRKILSTRKH